MTETEAFPSTLGKQMGYVQETPLNPCFLLNLLAPHSQKGFCQFATEKINTLVQVPREKKILMELIKLIVVRKLGTTSLHLQCQGTLTGTPRLCVVAACVSAQ